MRRTAFLTLTLIALPNLLGTSALIAPFSLPGMGVRVLAQENAVAVPNYPRTQYPNTYSTGPSVSNSAGVSAISPTTPQFNPEPPVPGYLPSRSNNQYDSSNAPLSNGGPPNQGFAAPPSFNQPPISPPQFGASLPGNIPLNRDPSLTQPVVQNKAFEPAKIVAIIGNQHILAGEIDGTINQLMAINFANMPAEDRERFKDELNKQREMLYRNQIMTEVQTKMIYLDFVRMIPADKMPEVQKRVTADFEKDLEAMRTKVAATKPDEIGDLVRKDPILARMAVIMTQAKAESLGELDQVLRQHGSSLEKQRRAYMEQKVGQMMIYKNIKQNFEVTHENMIEYYHEHAADYALPAKARWEQLTVRFDKTPDRQAAFQLIAAMGNEVYLGGTQFAAVAKRSSQAPCAEQGGYHDWTTKGGLASKVLDEAIFSLPLKKLSQIIEDDRGYHILRVLDRQEASVVPFLDAQEEIKEKLKNQRRQQDVKKYLEKIQKYASVWTIYDEDKESTEVSARKDERSSFSPR